MIRTLVFRSWAGIALLLFIAGSTLPLWQTRAVEPVENIVISEVMANAIDEDTDEFIELYNNSSVDIDLANWTVTDGDALDTIIAWDPLVHGTLTDPDVVTSTTILAPGAFAILMDSEYATGTQAYDVPPNTLILTVANTTLGNALTTTDAITLFDAASAVVSTYGTPIDVQEWQDRDDDALDGIPFNPGDGISAERMDVTIGDMEQNWQACADALGHTAGAPTSIPDAPEEPEEDPDPDDPERDDPDPPEDPLPPTPPQQETGDVRLSELFPNPNGSDTDAEFIELYNHETHDIDLSGWMVADGSREYVIGSRGENAVIPSHGFYVVERSTSGIALNNTTSEVVTLRDPFGALLDEIDYERANEAESFSRVDQHWQWTDVVTPNAANQPPADPTQENIPDDPESPLDPEQDPESNPNSEPLYQRSTDMHLSELLPNPSGSDQAEWIEVENRGSIEVDLRGWTISDGTTFYHVASSTVIGPNEFYVFKRDVTRIALNNSGDRVFLIDPDQKILEGVEYASSNEGQSFARASNGSWQWTIDPTPGKKNVIASDEDPEDTPEVSTSNISSQSQQPTSSSPRAATPRVVTIAQAQQASDNQRVVIEGIVTAAPGVVQDRILYMEDATGGIQVYSHTRAFPSVASGDRVRVTGVRSTANQEPRVKISATQDMQVLGTGTVSPLEIASQEQLASAVGRLITVSGSVIDQDGERRVIQRSDTSVLVDPGEFALEIGQSAEIIGVVTRSRSDIVMVALEVSILSESAESATTTASSDLPRDVSKPRVLGEQISAASWSIPGWGYGVVAAVTAVLGIVAWKFREHWMFWRKTRVDVIGQATRRETIKVLLE